MCTIIGMTFRTPLCILKLTQIERYDKFCQFNSISNSYIAYIFLVVPYFFQ